MTQNVHDRTRDRNRMAVWNYWKSYPFGTRIDCADDLKLNRQTVGKHTKAIRAGWIPKPQRAAE